MGTDEEEAHDIRASFSDASEYSPVQCAFSVRVLYASQFHALRMLCLADADGAFFFLLAPMLYYFQIWRTDFISSWMQE